MNNKIKMGVVEVDGVCIGDIIDNWDGVVVGFSEVDGEWKVDMRECGEEGWSVDLKDVVEDGIKRVKINNIKVRDYIDELDGSVEGCKLIVKFVDGYGLYENESGKLVIKNYGGKREFIYKVI